MEYEYGKRSCIVQHLKSLLPILFPDHDEYWDFPRKWNGFAATEGDVALLLDGDTTTARKSCMLSVLKHLFRK